MKIVELHPEDLFDKEDRGQLSGEERLLLDAHLSACPACRFERSVRSDFEQELSEDVLDGVPSLVAGALGALPKPPEVAPPPASPPKVIAPRSWLRRPAVLLAAAALLIAGGAAAQSGLASDLWKKSTAHLTSLLEPSPAVQASVVIPPTRGRAASENEPTPPTPASPSAAAPRVEAAANTDAAPSAGAASSPEVPGSPVAPVVLDPPRPSVASRKEAATPSPARALVQAETPSGRAKEETSPAAPPVETPAALFERANAARRHGAMGEAAGLYGELQAKHPRSAEARLATVLLARAQLDQGNARAALAGFDAYLGAGGGSLREEAMAGRAMALGRLGRMDEEKRAWEALLSTFPRSSYASLAERRLGSTAR